MTRLGLYAIIIVAGLASQTLRADAPPLCPIGNAVMNGTYVMSGTGTILGTGGGPLTFLGAVTYNGDGTGTVTSLSQNVIGSVGRATSIPASFTVNRDCTGSKIVGAGPTAQHFDFVITPDGKTITFIGTDGFAVLSGTAVRMNR
jgi:hypothetical protein